MKQFGRETLLLTLPVLLFGGVAWWKTRGGSMWQLQGAPSDLSSGKARLEIGTIKPLEMTPWDVAQGFVWGVEADVWQGGQSPVAPGVKRAAFVVNSLDADVYYQRDARWIKAKSPDGWSLVRESREEKQFGDFALRRDNKIKVRLESVPRDAKEVRLRGYFYHQNHYQNAGCRGISGGPGWQRYGTVSCQFTTRSKPFDIPIVGVNQAWPKPNVSRETELEFVDAKWIVDSGMDDFVLQLRRKDGGAWKNKGMVAAQNVEILDGNMQPIELFDVLGRKTGIYGFGSYNQEQFSPKRAKNDLFIPFVSEFSQTPKNGWSNVKPPVTLRAEISDGTCWPLKIDTKVERVNMKTEDFGAAK